MTSTVQTATEIRPPDRGGRARTARRTWGLLAMETTELAFADAVLEVGGAT